MPPNRRRKVPPQPAMFQLHAPIYRRPAPPPPPPPPKPAPPVEEATSALEEAFQPPKPKSQKEKEESKPPAKTSTEVPAAEPSIDTPTKHQEPPPPTKKTKGDNESDTDSITGEINKKEPPSPPAEAKNKSAAAVEAKDIPHKTSNKGDSTSSSIPAVKPAPVDSKATTDATAKSNDSDEDDYKPKSGRARTALKQPRNSSAGLAYAKRLAAKKKAEEEAARLSPSSSRGSKEDSSVGGEGGNEEKIRPSSNSKVVGVSKGSSKGNTKTASCKAKSGGVSSSGTAGHVKIKNTPHVPRDVVTVPGESGGSGGRHVKMKHTPRVPNDVPPRRLKRGSGSRKSEDSAEKGEGEDVDASLLKYPPEQMVAEATKTPSSRKSTRRNKHNSLGDNPKSPPQESMYQDYREVTIVPCPEIGEGWSKKSVARKNAPNTFDKYYLYKEKRFRSMTEVNRFLAKASEKTTTVTVAAVVEEEGESGGSLANKTRRSKRDRSPIKKKKPEKKEEVPSEETYPSGDSEKNEEDTSNKVDVEEEQTTTDTKKRGAASRTIVGRGATPRAARGAIPKAAITSKLTSSGGSRSSRRSTRNNTSINSDDNVADDILASLEEAEEEKATAARKEGEENTKKAAVQKADAKTQKKKASSPDAKLAPSGSRHRSTRNGSNAVASPGEDKDEYKKVDENQEKQAKATTSRRSKRSRDSASVEDGGAITEPKEKEEAEKKKPATAPRPKHIRKSTSAEDPHVATARRSKRSRDSTDSTTQKEVAKEEEESEEEDLGPTAEDELAALIANAEADAAFDEGEGASPHRPKRARKISMEASEVKMNEAVATALSAIAKKPARAAKKSVPAAPAKKKLPARKTAPQPPAARSSSDLGSWKAPSRAPAGTTKRRTEAAKAKRKSPPEDMTELPPMPPLPPLPTLPPPTTEASAAKKQPAAKSRRSAADEKALFEIGERIEAKYKGRGKIYYPGTIINVHPLGNRYDIDYDDSDQDRGLSVVFIRGLPPEFDTGELVEVEYPDSDEDIMDAAGIKEEESEADYENTEGESDDEDDGDKKPAAKRSPSKKPKKAPPRVKGSLPQNTSGKWIYEEKKNRTWAERMTMLRAHKEKYGSVDLTLAEKDEVDSLLKSFVLESRKQYKRLKNGRHSTMTKERMAELLALGFDFEPLKNGTLRANHDRRFQKQWDAQFEALEAYKAEHGDCLVSSMSKDPAHKKLGNWVRGQRKLFNKVGRAGFNLDRMARLEEMGFDFNPVLSGSYITKKRANMFPRVDANWEKHFQNLVKYKKETGNIIIGPNTKGPAGPPAGLYDWIHCQRKEYKKFQADEKALMYDKWVKKLNEIGFDWAPMKSDGFSKMLMERKNQKYNDLWQKHFTALQQFQKKKGHCYVPRNGKKLTLASWIHVQRKHKRNHDLGKKTPLSEERIRLLNEIGLDWNPSLSGGSTRLRQVDRDKYWEATFQKLCKWKEKRGHANPKKAEPQLGGWCARMRKMYVKNQKGEHTTLTQEKIAKLESIGFKFYLRTSEDDSNDESDEGATGEDAMDEDATGEEADIAIGNDATGGDVLAEAETSALFAEDTAEQEAVEDIIRSGDALIADAGSLPALPSGENATGEDTADVKVENNATTVDTAEVENTTTAV